MRTRCGPRWTLAALWLALIAGLVAPFYGLGRVPLMDTDEPRYAGTANEMAESGGWLYPRFNDEPRHAKPALVYWLIAASYRAFGVSEWSARLHAPVFSALIALGLLGVGRRWLGWEGGLIAAVVWVSLPQTTVWARACLTDNVLTFFIGGACLAVYSAGRAEGRAKWVAYLAAGLLSGCAMWVKGPVGLGVPVLVWLVHHRRPRAWWRELREGAALGGLVSLAVIAPWYVSQWHEYGGEYFRAFIAQDNVGRFSEAPPNQREWWSPLYFVGVFMVAAFPWSAGLPWAIARLRAAPRRGDAASLGGFALVWIVTVIAAFSLSATKNPQYIQSAYLALALMIAAGITQGSESGEAGWRWTIGLTVALGCVLLAAVALLPRVVSADAGRRGIELWCDAWPLGAMIISLLPLALGLPGLLAALMDRDVRGWSVVSAVVGLTLLVGPAAAYGPTVVEYRVAPFRDAGQALAGRMAPEGTIYTWGHGVRSSAAVFYSGRRTVEVPRDQGVRLPSLLKPGDALITRHDLLAELPSIEGLTPLEPSPPGLGRWVRVYVVERSFDAPSQGA